MTASAHVRRAVPGDADALGEVHVRVWRWAYRGQMPDEYLARLRSQRRAQIWRTDLAEGSIETWVAEFDGSVVGFAGTALARDDDLAPGTVELVMINVLEEYAGQGVGRALMERVETHWRAIGATVAVLWVLAGNERARGFYARLGWLPDGATGEYAVPGANIPQLRLRKRLT
jgi:GNAT superfamily N-acetyltransferase